MPHQPKFPHANGKPGTAYKQLFRDAAGNDGSPIDVRQGGPAAEATPDVTVIQGNPGDLRFPRDLEPSEQALRNVQAYEALRLQTYNDQAGLPTIGWGHLLRPNERYPNGVTRPQADAILQSDMRDAVEAVRQTIRVPLTQGQFDELVSFAFNVGPAGFARSELARKVNSWDSGGAAQQFLRWNHFYNPVTRRREVSRGLTRRRQIEGERYLRGTFPGAE